MVRSIFDTNGIPYPAVNFVSTLALAIMKTYSGIVFLFFFKKPGCSTKLINLQIPNSHTILSVAS